MADITFKTKIDFGNFGGNKKLTFTSWNDGEYKFDIRDWYEGGKVGKGITLTKTELLALYNLLENMDTDVEDDVEEDIEEVIEEIDEDLFPEEIQKKVDSLDKLFKGFKTERTYGELPFTKGERLQYLVEKGKKAFPSYEKPLEKLGLKSFVTGKGNLYIYTE